MALVSGGRLMGEAGELLFPSARSPSTCTGGGVGFVYERPGSIICRDDKPRNQRRPSGDLAALGWIRSPFHPGSAPSSAPRVVTFTLASGWTVQFARSAAEIRR